MNKRIIWSQLSINDFESILDYLQINWDYKVMQGFIEVTGRSVDLIQDNPKQFPLVNVKWKIRKCVLTKHNTLYYRDSKDKIDILRIFDTRQDPKKLTF